MHLRSFAETFLTRTDLTDINRSIKVQGLYGKGSIEPFKSEKIMVNVKYIIFQFFVIGGNFAHPRPRKGAQN